MSEHKKADIVGSTSKGMATTEVKAPLRSFRFKMWALGVVGALLILIFGGVAYYFVTRADNKPSPSSTTQTANSSSESLSQQIAKAATPTEKGQLYNQEMINALNSQQYSTAISTGMKAYAISPTSQTAGLIGTAYQAEGDNADAKTWFQDAINDLSKSSPTYHVDLGQYTSDLQEVSP